jgi:hypothetical protein
MGVGEQGFGHWSHRTVLASAASVARAFAAARGLKFRFQGIHDRRLGEPGQRIFPGFAGGE